MARKALIEKANKKPKYKVRSYSRCKICGRAHAFIRRFGICRICFREFALAALLPGVSKSNR